MEADFAGGSWEGKSKGKEQREEVFHLLSFVSLNLLGPFYSSFWGH